MQKHENNNSPNLTAILSISGQTLVSFKNKLETMWALKEVTQAPV